MKAKQIGLAAQDRKGYIAPPIPVRETKSKHETSRLKPQWHVVELFETKRRGEALRELSGWSRMYEV